MENDMLHYLCRHATRRFNGDIYYSGTESVFNLACLAEVINTISGIKNSIDGELLRMLLVGRSDVEAMPGGSHYRLKEL